MLDPKHRTKVPALEQKGGAVDAMLPMPLRSMALSCSLACCAQPRLKALGC